MTEGRSFTEQERAEWEERYQRWSRITEEVTAEMQLQSARRAYERRAAERREAERRKQHIAIELPDDRRSGAERRDSDRRSGVDRRDPFKDHAAGKFPKIDSKD